jgi:hypothetical protein
MVDKVCTPDEQDAPGTIDWTIVVTNIGNVELTGVVLTDATLGINVNIGTLASGASDTTTAQQTGLAAGTYTNTATADGLDQLENKYTDSDPASCEVVEQPEFEYFVGGGKILIEAGDKPKDNVYLTHGFELHCDALSGPNNLEVNWAGDNRFHLEELEKADCNDDGSVNEPPPSRDNRENGPGPTTDVYQGEGWGRYNGSCGAFAEWVFDDNGEPGKADHIVALQIHDADGNLVLDLNPGELGTRDTSSAGTWKEPGTDDDPWFDLITGNHQWVPHPTPTHGPTGTQPCEEVTPSGP